MRELHSFKARRSSPFLLFLLEHYLACLCWCPPFPHLLSARCRLTDTLGFQHRGSTQTLVSKGSCHHYLCSSLSCHLFGESVRKNKVLFPVSQANSAQHCAMNISANIWGCPLTPFRLARLLGDRFRSCRLRAECHKATHL